MHASTPPSATDHDPRRSRRKPLGRLAATSQQPTPPRHKGRSIPRERR
ncbi:hypothetical protein HUT16_04305 [Kitasatospora sp. NA04385]|nr:hypothetical protein [Kitasatospora sp. NA04385]QKW18391.1 hypothetical protein HUT16_04305 [Kitasatospora sp. NA04385]